MSRVANTLRGSLWGERCTCYLNSGGIKAGLHFKDDKNVDAIGKSGKTQPATYTIEGTEIIMVIDLKFMKIKNHFDVSEDKKELVLYSKENDKTVIYRKL